MNMIFMVNLENITLNVENFVINLVTNLVKNPLGKTVANRYKLLTVKL